ncbi:endonuclease [Kibdelosporangium aridum]|uniref:Endonuclease n=1 Tax=Kibdelosporangium aridum TaxID=2030 RepID=A0A428ZDA1_KIBAR|nr:endonuclease [Kibdelosporangium aridum]RSM85948.1 endonuclease [Kibdelosporangium aridum]
MRRSILTCLSTVLLTAGAVASPVAQAAAVNSFSVLTYNVAGLPEGLSSGNPATNTPLISPRLAGYEVVAVQEDFNYHAALYAGDNHPFRTPTSGPAGFGDGLNILSRYQYSDFHRIKWGKCNGTDCLTPKGFSLSRIRLAEGVYVDLYNLHPNAGTTTADLAARRANITQLTQYIAANSAGNAVIVSGDTNTRYTRTEDNIRELVSGAGLTDAWVQLVRGGNAPAIGSPALVCDPAAVTNSCEVVDKILYRGNRFINLTAREYNNENQKFLDSAGKPLSDHYPHKVRFEWSLNDRIRMSDQFGGPHATPFTDVDRLADGVGVRSIQMRGAERLDHIGLALTDGTVLAHGGNGGSATAMTLNQGERIVKITLSQGKRNGHTRIFSAALTTDQGRTLSAGRPTSDTVTYTAPPGWQITGFTGRSGAEVDKLGVIYQP